jgi:hypothetical protein
MLGQRQGSLFRDLDAVSTASKAASSTFVGNMTLPVHRWFRYSAGFSAEWAGDVIRQRSAIGPTRVLDPFAGSATTLIASEEVGVESWGVESHPFVCRVARAKLAYRSCPNAYLNKARETYELAKKMIPMSEGYPALIYKCYDEQTLAHLDMLRQAYNVTKDSTPASDLLWLTIVAILRRTSKVGTAQWQYVLPRKQKQSPQHPFTAFEECRRTIYADMVLAQSVTGPRAHFLESDARTCEGVPNHEVNLVVTSPPYPNNYDYADATRLEMSFLQEIAGWGDLQGTIRRHLVRSCSQHVPEKSVDLQATLQGPELTPIRDELTGVCEQLSEIRKSKGGRKTYHLMIACYFRDLALVWGSLRRVCTKGSSICFVIGDSAPYGVYVPVIPWLGELAIAAGFKRYHFEQTRLRNIKWKNRKHRVPLQEGRLWVEG